ncbi:MAG TPA: carbohydrate-binding domain-containing protein [Polyangiaceae bacterium]|nr:carbohydrate-binding domain-containing protein [Polyangiaceae bacterium]
MKLGNFTSGSVALGLMIVLAGCSVEAGDSEEELGSSHAALITKGIGVINPDSFYWHSTDASPSNEGATGAPGCAASHVGTDVDYWFNSEPLTNGCHIGWNMPGESYAYGLGVDAVPAPPAGQNSAKMDVVLRVGSMYSGRRITVRMRYMGDKSTPIVRTTTVTAPNVGQWGKFADVYAFKYLDMYPGMPYNLEVVMVDGEMDFNGFEIRPAYRVEAENALGWSDTTPTDQGNSPACTRNNSIDIEPTSDPAGGTCDVGWTVAGEWLGGYAFPPVPGDYRVIARSASAITGKFKMSLLGQTSAEKSVATGGWQNWTDVTVFDSITIPGGGAKPTWNVSFTADGANLNYLEFQLIRPCADAYCSSY